MSAQVGSLGKWIKVQPPPCAGRGCPGICATTSRYAQARSGLHRSLAEVHARDARHQLCTDRHSRLKWSNPPFTPESRGFAQKLGQPRRVRVCLSYGHQESILLRLRFGRCYGEQLWLAQAKAGKQRCVRVVEAFLLVETLSPET